MLGVLIVVGALAAALGVWGFVRGARGEPMVGRQIPALAAVEVGLVLQCVVAGVLAARGAIDADPFLLWGYLITQLLLLPLAFGWAFVERTRWSSVVLGIASVVVVVLQVRIWQVWVSGA